MNWVREIKRSIISLQELCLDICSLAPPVFNFFQRGNKFCNQLFSITWISEAVDFRRVTAGFHPRESSRGSILTSNDLT